MKIFNELIASLKNIHHNFVAKNIDESNSIIKVDKICKRYMILSSDGFANYINGDQRIAPNMLTIFSRTVLTLYLLRFFAIFISDNQLIKYITCDFNYMIGNTRLISVMMTVCITTVLLVASHLQYQEIKYNSQLFKFLHLLKTKSLDIKLNARNERKFALRVNLITEYMLIFFHKIITLFVGLAFTSCLLFAYCDYNNGYLLIIVIFWVIISILWSMFFYSYVCLVVIIWYSTTLFLRYKFSEINESIETSFKTRDKHLLLHSIDCHNCAAVLTHSVNKYFSFLIYIVYYIGTPALQLICYVSHEKDTVLPIRFLAAFVFTSIFSMVFLMNLLSANVIHSAHKSYSRLYMFLAKNDLTLRDMLTIQTFIERLSGPRIGFYCLNMFPMTNNEFYKYISISCMNYILIISNL